MIHEVDWEGGSKTTWKYSTFICFYLFLLKGSFTTTKSSVLKYFNILFTIVKFPYCGGGAHTAHLLQWVLKYFFVLSYVYATMQCVLCHNLFIKNIHFIYYNFIYILITIQAGIWNWDYLTGLDRSSAREPQSQLPQILCESFITKKQLIIFI